MTDIPKSYAVFMGSIRRIFRNVAAPKSITIATHIAQIASREKLPTTIENNILADSSTADSVLLYSYIIFLSIFIGYANNFECIKPIG